MCYILVSTCSSHQPHTCAHILRTRYTQCSHAALHSLDPTRCPSRMKRRQISDGGICERCEDRRSSLSVLPRKSLVDSLEGVEIRKRRLSCAMQGRPVDTDTDGESVGDEEDGEEGGVVERRYENERRGRKTSLALSMQGKDDANPVCSAPELPTKRTRKRRAITKRR